MLFLLRLDLYLQKDAAFSLLSPLGDLKKYDVTSPSPRSLPPERHRILIAVSLGDLKTKPSPCSLPPERRSILFAVYPRRPKNMMLLLLRLGLYLLRHCILFVVSTRRPMMLFILTQAFVLVSTSREALHSLCCLP